MFLILFRNIFCPQQKFPSLRSSRNIMGNNVSSFARALKPSPWISFHFNDGVRAGKPGRGGWEGQLHGTFPFKTVFVVNNDARLIVSNFAYCFGWDFERQ